MRHRQRILFLAILGAMAGLEPVGAEVNAPPESQLATTAAAVFDTAGELRERKEQSRRHVAPPAAAEPAFPRLRAEILVELQSDTDLDSTAHDHYLRVEPAVSIGLSEHFSIEAGFVLEPVSDPRPGRDRWFDDEGLS